MEDLRREIWSAGGIVTASRSKYTSRDKLVSSTLGPNGGGGRARGGASSRRYSTCSADGLTSCEGAADVGVGAGVRKAPTLSAEVLREGSAYGDENFGNDDEGDGDEEDEKEKGVDDRGQGGERMKLGEDDGRGWELWGRGKPLHGTGWAPVGFTVVSECAVSFGVEQYNSANHNEMEI